MEDKVLANAGVDVFEELFKLIFTKLYDEMESGRIQSRHLDFLKPGARMAIVLPQGRFNNSSDKRIRDFIAERCRILAVVGLHGNVFKPHTGTKTSVLFVQKWDERLCPKKEDYPIFFATMQEQSKDNSGDKIYLQKKDFEQFQVQPESPVPGQLELDMAEERRAFYVKTAKDLDEFR